MTGTRKGNGKSKQKKNSKSRARSNVKAVGPFPPLVNRTFRYNDYWSATEAATGTGVFYAMSTSALNDPNSTGVGHQPMYYDQMFSATGPYLKFLALSTTAIMDVANLSIYPMMCCVYASANNTTPASLTQALEKPYSRRFMIAGNTGGPCAKRVVFSFPHERALGVTKQHLLTDDYYAGVYNASPSVNCFLNFYAVTIAGTGAGAITINWELDINANCYSLGNQSTS